MNFNFKVNKSDKLDHFIYYPPPSNVLDSWERVVNGVDLFIKPNALLNTTCDSIVNFIDNNKNKHYMSRTTMRKDSKNADTFRTSTTMDLSQKYDVTKVLDMILTNELYLNIDYSETYQAQIYSPGQYFKPHYDYFVPRTNKYTESTNSGGQRTWTFMVYLNDVEEGGETEFTELGLKIKAKKGTAVLWNNIAPDCSLNKKLKHQGTPVKSGKKYIITKWFRERPREKI